MHHMYGSNILPHSAGAQDALVITNACLHLHNCSTVELLRTLFKIPEKNVLYLVLTLVAKCTKYNMQDVY